MPMQIRGKGTAFAVGIGNWAVGTLWNQISPVALGGVQWKFSFVFVAWSQCRDYFEILPRRTILTSH